MRTLAAAIVLAALVLPATAQDAAQDAGAKQPPPEVTEFNKLFDEWKRVLARLSEIQVEYQKAKPEDRQALRKEFYEELLPRAEEMAPQMPKLAEASYQADPTQKHVADYIAAMAKDAQDQAEVQGVSDQVAHAQHAEALRLAKMLIANDFPNPEIYEVAGRGAHDVTADLTVVENYLQTAADAGAISPSGMDILRNVQKEVQTRKAEDKPDSDPMALPRVLLKTTKGDIVLELYENEAPNTVANFIYLIEKGYYDGLTFHRVLDGFMAQGGAANPNGSGGPGYTIPCECYEPDYRLHFPGTVSMAHTGARDSAGSQFFLTFRRTRHLDGKHTVFGRVISGLDVLDKLQRRTPGDPDAPEADKIVSATVLRKRDHEYKPKVSGENPGDVDELFKMPGSGDDPAPPVQGGAKSGDDASNDDGANDGANDEGSDGEGSDGDGSNGDGSN